MLSTNLILLSHENFVSITVMVKLWFNDGQASSSPVLLIQKPIKIIKNN